MNFYIATGLERAAEAKQLKAALEALGHKCTYDWTEHGSVQDDGPERIAEVANNEAKGVRDADLFVALLPGARGTHTEFGIAIAIAEFVGSSQRFVVVIGPLVDASGRECAFYRHRSVSHRFETAPELLAWLRGLAEGRNGGVRYARAVEA